MATGAKTLKFPTPGATKEKESFTLISAERMLIHYNQDHPELKTPAKRITPKIVDHIGKLAVDSKWAGAVVAKDAITGHTSGMVLARAKPPTPRPHVIDAEIVQPRAIEE